MKVKDTYHSLTGVRACAKWCRKKDYPSMHAQIHALMQQRSLQKEVLECSIFHKPPLLSQRRSVRRRKHRDVSKRLHVAQQLRTTVRKR
jgi:hypothetical protein